MTTSISSLYPAPQPSALLNPSHTGQVTFWLPPPHPTSMLKTSPSPQLGPWETNCPNQQVLITLTKLQNIKGQGGTATILQGAPGLRIQRDYNQQETYMNHSSFQKTTRHGVKILGKNKFKLLTKLHTHTHTKGELPHKSQGNCRLSTLQCGSDRERKRVHSQEEKRTSK